MTLASGSKLAAMVLTRLPKDAAEGILSRLGPETTAKLRAEMKRLEAEGQSPELLAQAVQKLEQQLAESKGKPAGPRLAVFDDESPSASAAVATGKKDVALPPPAPPKLKVVRASEPDEPDPELDYVEAIRRTPSDRLARALQGENARTVALLINQLDAEPAGEVLKRLTAEVRNEVTVRLGQGVGGGSEVVRRMARAVLQKVRLLPDDPAVQDADVRVRKMSDMLRLLPKPDRMESLTALEAGNAELAAQIRDLLYQFEDLLLIEDRSMQKLLTEVDAKSLALSLKDAPGEIAEKVSKNLSKRAQESLKEEMEFLGVVAPAQVRDAQKAVVAVIQRLDQAGELVMAEN